MHHRFLHLLKPCDWLLSDTLASVLVMLCPNRDRRFFLHTLGQACEVTGWRVHAWVLMGNHYHLFIQSPEPNLVAGIA
jgi:REP element-mobilizing transposase RayT